MRLSNSEHASEGWLIGRIAPDFELLDAWALPVGGSSDDFASLVEIMTSLDPARASGATRTLFALRARLGRWFGWDDAATRRAIPGCSETTLGARVPEALRDSAKSLATGVHAFVPLYRTDEEWAAEISNDTVHGVLHLAWVDQGEGRHRGQLGVYVKPRGRLGRFYLKLIAPFRHWIVYPALMRHIGRAWDARARRGPG